MCIRDSDTTFRDPFDEPQTVTGDVSGDERLDNARHILAGRLKLGASSVESGLLAGDETVQRLMRWHRHRCR